jgi:hypothetical protein
MPDLDAFDLAILDILQRDNATPQRLIGEAVSLSAPAVQRRIKRLEADGVIAANVAVIDPASVGQAITIVVEVSVELFLDGGNVRRFKTLVVMDRVKVGLGCRFPRRTTFIQSMSDRSTRPGDLRSLTAVLGPTNTGKTHLAVERMLGHASGMIGLPLRLLAREIYDRVVKLRGKASVALITGEEKITPPRASLFRLHRRGHAAGPRGRVPGHRRDPAVRRSRARPHLHPPPAARPRQVRDHAAGPAPWPRWSAACCPTPRSCRASGSPTCPMPAPRS